MKDTLITVQIKEEKEKKRADFRSHKRLADCNWLYVRLQVLQLGTKVGLCAGCITLRSDLKFIEVHIEEPVSVFAYYHLIATRIATEGS